MTAPPGEHERLISDWRERLDRIKDELMRAHLHQYVWTSMRDEIQKQPGTDGTFLVSYSAVYVGSQDFVSAYVVQRRLAAVAEDPLERRDLGMLCLQLDRPGEAIDPLAAYLKSRPKADDSETVQALLAGARAMVAQWN